MTPDPAAVTPLTEEVVVVSKHSYNFEADTLFLRSKRDWDDRVPMFKRDVEISWPHPAPFEVGDVLELTLRPRLGASAGGSAQDEG